VPATAHSNSSFKYACVSEHEEVNRGSLTAMQVETLSSKGVQVDKERKKQILGDILVWAEITQEHYDEEMQR